MSEIEGAPLDWYYYRQLAIGYQRRYREVEIEIEAMWKQANAATNPQDQRTAYWIHLSKEREPAGFMYMNLVGERTRLLALITAATSMSMMLYQQRGDFETARLSSMPIPLD
jgi:hypothetical protein